MKNTRWIAPVMSLLLGLALARCEETQDEGNKPETTEGTGKEDAWNYDNDPRRFNTEMIVKLTELPRDGSAAQMPWSETWWPMRKDGFNQRWQGSGVLSPLEKYDQAFNRWTPPDGFMSLRPFSYPGSEYDKTYYEKLGKAAKWESANGGNAQARNGRDDDGDGKTDESDDWDGLGSWWGKCHMWSAVSILVPEPKHPVTYNGVRFEYSDLTALVMETSYNRSKAYMLGDRCNAEEVRKDEYGRPTMDECRDTNAGSFHVVVANMLGRHKRAFVMDKSSDSQVWNHPVTDFSVTKLEEVTLQKALQLLGRTDTTTYPYNPDAKAFYEAELTLGFATDSVSPQTQPHGNVRSSDSYHYLLELDGSANVIGGEWIGELGPDFFWLPVMANYARGGNPEVNFNNVKILLDMASGTAAQPDITGDEKKAENTTKAAIPDNSPAGVTSAINVTDTGSVTSLKVRVNITHTYIGDLTVELRRGGKSVVLHNASGGSTDNLDEEYAVTDFNGSSVGGAWELFVADKAGQDTGELVSWSIVYLAGGGTSPATAPRTVTYENTTAAAIPDNKASGVRSAVSVPDTGKVKKVIVKTNITHPYIGDLKVELRHAGTGILLHNRTGGSNDNIVKEFTLSDFNSLAAAGAWELVVSDNAKRDTGRLVGWTLVLTVE